MKTTIKELTRLFLPKIAVIVFLIFALENMSYGYYTLMRYALFFCFIMFIVEEYADSYILCLLAVLLMILFNPMIPVRMDKSTWHIADKITIAITGCWILYDVYRVLTAKNIKSNE